MFNKKDDERKTKKENQDKLKTTIQIQNKDIETNHILLDQESRRLEDPHLLKKQQEVTRQLKQDSNKINIDINIAESRIKDLEGLKEMTLSQIREILAEKRKLDKDNMDLEQRIQGKGLSEQETKAKQIDAEREQKLKIQNSLKFQKENANNLMERLKEEEINGKNMLDEKIKLQQELNLLNENLAEIKGIQLRNRQELITLQVRKSQLEALEIK